MAGFPIVNQSFSVGFLTVRYYSLFFVAGVVIAYFIAKAKA
jgi:prolipoprotein diacylglyceryltransferase